MPLEHTPDKASLSPRWEGQDHTLRIGGDYFYFSETDDGLCRVRGEGRNQDRGSDMRRSFTAVGVDAKTALIELAAEAARHRYLLRPMSR